MSLGRRISPDPVGGNFGNVTGFASLYDHGIDPAAALLNVITQDIHALGGAAPIISAETPPVLSDKSLSFDGTQELNLGDNFDLGAGDFAVAFFYRKVDALISDDATLISKGTVGSDEWHIHLNLGPQKRVEWLVNAQAIELQSPNGSADDELWHHVAIVRLGSTITMYFDGTNVDSDTDSTDLTNSKDLVFGFRGGAPFFGGFMTGIRIYSDDLTAAQVSNLNSGGDEPTNETSFFRMAAADILSAPNGNHGTLTGGAFFDSSTLAGQLQGKTGADEILAVFHDGVDDTVTFPAVTMIGEFTAALWFKPDDLTLQTLVGDVVTDRIQIGSSTTILVVVGAGTLTFTVPAMDTDWHSVVVSRDASDNIRVFLDDVESTTGALVDAADATFAKIGAHGAAATDPFDGHTAKVVLEPREWSATERASYFDDGSTTSPFTDFRSNTGLITDAEPGATAGTVSTQFDGVNDRIQTLTVPVVSYPLSLTSWVRIRPTVSGASSAIWLGDTSVVDVEIGIDVRGTDGFARAFSRNTGTFLAAIGAVDLRDDTWHFLCGLFDNEFSRKIYVDSVEIDEQTGQTPFPNINAIAIGRASLLTPSRFTEGQIRDPRIYNRTLTQTDINNLFAHAAVPDGLLGNFPLATEGNIVADNIGDFADTAQDSSAGARHGTLFNFDPDPNLGWVQSVPPQLVGQQVFSLSFVAASLQFVRVDSVPITVYPYTLSAWVKTTSVSVAIVWVGTSSAPDNWITLSINSSGFATAQSRNTTTRFATSTTKINDGLWHHVAGVYSGPNSRKIFIDGVEENENTENSTPTFNRLTVGRLDDSSPGNHMDGTISDVRVYDTDLSDADVALLSGGNEPSTATVFQWKLDDARVFETMLAWADDAYADTTRFGTSDKAEGIPFNDSDYVENVIIPAVNTTGILGASCIPPASERFVSGIPGTGVRLRQAGANTASFDIQSPVSFELSGIEIDGNAQGGGNLVTLSGAAHNVHHNLLHDLINTTVSAGGIELKTGTTGSTIHNNFIFALTTTTGACTGILSAVVCDIFANSILSMLASTGADGAGISLTALAVLINNIAADSDFDFVGTEGTGSTKNVSSDGTALGTLPITGEAGVDLFVAVTPGSENLHLLSTAAAINQGLNLDSTGVIGIGVDIDGSRRPTVWDIGADESTAAPPAGEGGGDGAGIISRTRRRRRLLMSPVR